MARRLVWNAVTIAGGLQLGLVVALDEIAERHRRQPGVPRRTG